MNNNLLKQKKLKDWETKELKDLVLICNGKTPLRTKKEFWENGTVSWFTIDDLRTQGRIIKNTAQKITDEAVKKTNIKILPPNTTLICCTASVGECAFSEIELSTNQQFNGLVVKDKDVLDNKFLYYLVSSFDKKIKSLAGTTTIGFVSVGKIGEIKVLLPEYSEQRKIADILSSIDDEIQNLSSLISKTEKIKKGILLKLFTKGIGSEKVKKTEIGVIPECWNVYSLQELLNENILLDHLDGNHGELYPKSKEFVEEGVPYLSANCIIDNKITLKNAKFLPFERAKAFKKGVAKNKDVLFAHNATVGPVAVLNTSLPYVILSTTLTYYRCNLEKLIPEYLYYYMQTSLFEGQYKKVMKQTTRNQVPITAQRKLLHVIPDLGEQKSIVNILTAIDYKLDVVKSLRLKIEELKKGLMSDLLTGKVRTIKK